MVTNTVGSTLSGPSYLLKGLKLLGHRRIRLFAIVPVLINILLFIWLTTLAVNGFEGAMAWMEGWLTGWPAWIQWFFDFLSWLLWAAFVVLLLILYAYTFTLFSNLIGTPFYGLLAERVQEVLTGQVDSRGMTFKRATAIAISAIKRTFTMLAYTLPRAIGVGLASLVLLFTPLGFVGSIISFLWGAWSLALEYLDYTSDNNEQSFPALLSECREQRNRCLGFGASALAATSIPVLNIIVAPAAVAAGAAMWIDRFGSGQRE
ncbi:sulfate transporter CysZ [bacterium SCSIO 12696]|nr:sulfate transporter CysZ [bacterium SCSIO 12696]